MTGVQTCALPISPWGVLQETGAVDGFEDVFPNGAGAIDNAFASGGGGEV